MNMVLLHLILLSLFASLSLSTKFTAALDTLSPNQTLADAAGRTLVSAGESFELGFFSPPNSKNRYVGVWFKQVSLRTPIWVANKNDPLTNSSGVLTITPTGNIILTSNQTNPIWSSNSTILSASTPVLRLLDTGNLVVVNTNTGNYLWQSFDYPCDTLVPGMKLGWDLSKNQEWYLTSWKSLQDPSTGDFTYRVDPRGLPELVLREGSTIRYRSGPWDGVRFGGGPPLKENTVFSPSFAFNESFVYYSFVNSDDNIISRFVVNQTGGSIQHLTWNQGSGKWVVIVTLQADTCDTYELCGSYGICNVSGSPICHCADGFVPKNPLAWKRLDWTDGCLAKTELNCSVAAGFRKFSMLKLPETSYFLVNRTEVSRVDCEEACLRNCSCMAFAQTEVRGCVVWSGDLLDMREYNEGGQDLYIRMAASELEQYLKSQQSHGKKGKVAAIAASVTAALLLTFCLSCWFVVKKRKETREEKILLFSPYNTTSLEASSMGKHFDGSGTNAELPYFDLSIIVSATDNFSLANKLGEGGFGTVYKGRLHDGEEIAVKRLAKNSGQGVEEFKTEVTLIAKLQHRNLVRLLGYCIQREEKMLIYEYLPNKGLDSFVFDRTKSSFIDWKTRFNIILGIARGLLYLHQDSRLRIIHRDLKASNVLLDAEMNPKISDFGMARIFGGNQIEANTNRVVGTYGYMSPEYAMEGLFSIKSDVFSFGVLLLEIISGRKNSSYYKDNFVNLIGHVWSLWNEGRAEELVDSTMSESYSDKEVLRCIHIGLLCVQESANDRPNMSDVAFMLCNETVLTPPKQPAFIFKGADSRPETSSSASLGAVSVNDVTMSAIRGR